MLKIINIKEKEEKVDMKALATAVEVLIKDGFVHTDADFVQFLQEEGETVEDNMPAALGAFMAEISNALNLNPFDVIGFYTQVLNILYKVEAVNEALKDEEE